MKTMLEQLHIRGSRRNFVLAALAALASASSKLTLAASEEGLHHHSPGNSGLVDSAIDCAQKGRLCRDHCIELVKNGDTSIADCLDIVTDTISMCDTLVQLTISESRHLKSFASVCVAVCKDCEKECRVHKDKHEACNACMLSCQQCIEQLETIVA